MATYGESEYIYGLHAGSGNDGGSERVRWSGAEVLQGKGWVVFTEALGHDPDDAGGVDYRPWADRGLGVIVRLNHGYGEAGTIPAAEQWEAFAARVGRFVAASRGCHLWVIGNEFNHSQERPYGMKIQPEDAAEVYAQCRYEIRQYAGHEDDVVMVGAVAPWNVETGDWLAYYERLLYYCMALGGGVDALCWHAYTHGSDPSLVWSAETMDAPYEDRLFHLQQATQFFERTPAALQGLPIYITECNQGGEWEDANRGWIRLAYAAAMEWRAWQMDVRCVAMYRWPQIDQWSMVDKPGVLAGMEAALAEGYRWTTGGDEVADELRNLYFQGEWAEQDGISQLKVFTPWRVWWRERTEGDPDSTNFRPEAAPIADADKVNTGPTAQKIWTNHATHEAGLMQGPIAVTAGREVTFRIYAKQGVKDSKGKVRIGIDPTGGVDPWSPDIVWSEEVWEPYDAFVELSARAVSQGQVTVWTYAWFEWPGAWCDTYWDTATWIVEDPYVPPTTPPDGTLAELVARLETDVAALKGHLAANRRSCYLIE